jgi:hypothetical protein
LDKIIITAVSHHFNRFFTPVSINNKMERMNGELRDREKVVRGVKKEESPLLTGLQIYHNYIRPHMGLDDKTPADLAGIKVEGDNKWITLIQNASKKNH